MNKNYIISIELKLLYNLFFLKVSFLFFRIKLLCLFRIIFKAEILQQMRKLSKELCII